MQAQKSETDEGKAKEESKNTSLESAHRNKFCIIVDNCQQKENEPSKKITKHLPQDDSEIEKLSKSPEKAVFDAGFFKVETPVKKKVVEKQFTPGKPDQKVLASTLLKERLNNSPFVHKDYSPCIRVTRSMKAKGVSSRKLTL
ncbi:uncharacterized protein [Cherax quadricarinatus]